MTVFLESIIFFTIKFCIVVIIFCCSCSLLSLSYLCRELQTVFQVYDLAYSKPEIIDALAHCPIKIYSTRVRRKDASTKR